MAESTLERLTEDLESAAKSNDPQELNRALSSLIEQLPREPGAIETELARRGLKALRSNRRFGHMRMLAQAFIDDGCDDPQVTRQFSQALIEAGETSPAIGLLESVINDDKTPFEEWAEAKGLLGRAWKDRAVRTRGVRDDVAAMAIKTAFDSYRDAYEKDPALIYQGINHVALAALDRGLSLSKQTRNSALKTARDIFERVNDTPEGNRTAWDIATAAEALIAQGKTEESISWFRSYVTHKDTDSFALAGTIRQLSEIWEIGNDDDGGELLAPLHAKLLELPGGRFTISNEELKQMASVSSESYEKVLGDIGPRTYRWMKRGFDLARSVALIRKNGRGFGTGFIVKGSSLDERLGDELLVLTNSHVVSAPPLEGAARPDQVTINFELAAQEETTEDFQVAEILWQSPPTEHDASLLRLDPAIPDTFEEMQFSNNLPILDENETQRIYIIGHPGGGEISFSFEDNELLDYELHLIDSHDDPAPCRVHYRTPTEQGNSGSPIFNGNWRAIGIHHKGGTGLPKLNGQEGLYAANEGIWIESIRRKIRQEL